VDCLWVFSDLESALRAARSAGPMVRAINHAGEDAVRAALTEALTLFRLSEGSCRLENKFHYMITTAWPSLLANYRQTNRTFT
jgi:hypothetical protein